MQLNKKAKREKKKRLIDKSLANLIIKITLRTGTFNKRADFFFFKRRQLGNILESFVEMDIFLKVAGQKR